MTDLHLWAAPVFSVTDRMGWWWLDSCTHPAHSSPAHILICRKSEIRWYWIICKHTALCLVIKKKKEILCSEYFFSYITGKLSDVHGMHGLFVDATPLIVPLHVIGVILFVFILQTQSEWACIWLHKIAQHSNALNIEYAVILWV